MKLDILAFGAHPDDVELSCSGTLLVEKNNGKNIGVIDLTEGELGTRGTIESRYSEAEHALKILNLDCRENLQLQDGFFENDKETRLKVIHAIRKYKPEIVICNAPDDRHPDHARAAKLVSDSSFLSGLMKIETFENGKSQEAWRPKYVLHYIQDRYLEPDFVIDITEMMEKKLEAIKAYKTQFYNPEIDGPETYISKPEFIEQIVGRNKLFGKRIGVKYAEGFISNKKIGLKTLDALVKENT